MLRTITIAAALVATSIGASAADVPFAQRYPTVSPTYDWTGVYAGLTGGYTWANSEYKYGDNYGTYLPANQQMSVQGFLLGGVVGAQKQFGRYVLGLEADASYTNLKHRQSSNQQGLVCSSSTCFDYLSTTTTDTTTPLVVTARARIGYAFDKFLLYGTGGLAAAQLKTQATTVESWSTYGSTYRNTDTRYALGYAVGGGMEWAFARNWIAGVEYLYVNLGLSNTDSAYGYSQPSYSGGGTSFSKTTLDAHLARAKIVYKF